MPSKAEFEYRIEHCLALSGHSQDEKAKEFLLNHLEKNSYIYSFKKLSKKLVQLHELIENDVKAHGKPIDKIYYNVINAKKSYGLINYIYQKANNILSPSKQYCRDTSMLFSYFTPDNNSPYLRNLFVNYFPQESFVKDSMVKVKVERL